MYCRLDGCTQRLPKRRGPGRPAQYCCRSHADVARKRRQREQRRTRCDPDALCARIRNLPGSGPDVAVELLRDVLAAEASGIVLGLPAEVALELWPLAFRAMTAAHGLLGNRDDVAREILTELGLGHDPIYCAALLRVMGADPEVLGRRRERAPADDDTPAVPRFATYSDLPAAFSRHRGRRRFLDMPPRNARGDIIRPEDFARYLRTAIRREARRLEAGPYDRRVAKDLAWIHGTQI